MTRPAGGFVRILFLAFLSFLFACQSSQKTASPEGPLQKGRWESKAVIKNIQQNESHQVSIDIVAIKNHRLRLDVTATLGYNVASFVMGRENFKCAVYPEKKFYEGPISEKAMTEALNFPVSPRVFYSIAFDEPIQLAGWKCEMDDTGLVRECLLPQRQLKIEWMNRNEGKKVVKITSPTVEMNWLFYAPERDFEEKQGLFSLQPPNGFERKNL